MYFCMLNSGFWKSHVDMPWLTPRGCRELTLYVHLYRFNGFISNDQLRKTNFSDEATDLDRSQWEDKPIIFPLQCLPTSRSYFGIARPPLCGVEERKGEERRGGERTNTGEKPTERGSVSKHNRSLLNKLLADGAVCWWHIATHTADWLTVCHVCDKSLSSNDTVP